MSSRVRFLVLRKRSSKIEQTKQERQAYVAGDSVWIHSRRAAKTHSRVAQIVGGYAVFATPRSPVLELAEMVARWE